MEGECATSKHMAEVGIRALKQNASAVVAEASAGHTVTITDRGRAVAQLSAIPGHQLLKARCGAAALDLGDDLDGLVTYDERLGEAARLNGITVLAPG